MTNGEGSVLCALAAQGRKAKRRRLRVRRRNGRRRLGWSTMPELNTYRWGALCPVNIPRHPAVLDISPPIFPLPRILPPTWICRP
jgi:hypothetical protein